MEKITYQLQDRDAELRVYKVFADCVFVGEVWSAWFRLGGQSWTYGDPWGYPSRQEAARALINKNKKTTLSEQLKP